MTLKLRRPTPCSFVWGSTSRFNSQLTEQLQLGPFTYCAHSRKRNLLLSPKARQDCGTNSKLPHVRVVMEANAALFVHQTARSLYEYSVPFSPWNWFAAAVF